jgi:hypothetical protein
LRKISLLLAFLFMGAIPAFGQVTTTSVSGTISDANGQAFVSGTWSAVLIAASGGTGQPFVCGGVTLSSSQVQQSGNLDSSGAFTATMVSNSCISPSGSLWQFTFNPAATSAPYIQSVFIFGTSQSLTSSITPPAITVNNNQVFTIAYTDGEVFGFKEGSFYWNVLTPALRVYHSGAWTTVGGGGGGSGVTSIATTGPITGGPITTTGTLACPTCGVTGSPLSQFAATTSAQLFGVLTNPTGTGFAVFGTSPTLVTPALGTPTALVLTNATGLPNAGLVNTGTTVNSQTCTLGSTCTIPTGLVFPATVSGTVNSGGIPCFSSATNEQSSALLTLNFYVLAGGAGACPGVGSLNENSGTLTTTEPIAAGASVSTTADGVHPSAVSMVGNTTLPTLGSNTFSLIGPPAATFTSWSLQSESTIPVTTDLFSCVVTGTNCVLHDSGIPASGAGFNAVIKTLTGCNTATFVYTPQAADCVAPSGGTAPSLDQVTGSAAQATATETAIGHGVTEAGIETTAATYPYIFRNTNATNTATGAVVVDTSGAGTGQIPFVIEQETIAGNAFEICTGGSIAANVLTCGTIHLAFSANADVLNVGSSSGIIQSGSGANTLTVQGNGEHVIVKSGLGTAANVITVPTGATADVVDFDVNLVTQSGIGPTGIVGNPGIQTVTGADYTNSTVTPSTVFSFTLPPTVAAKTYKYSCDIMWESTGVTLVGPVFGLNISAAPTQLTGSAWANYSSVAGAQLATTGYLSNTTTGSQTLITATAAGVTSTNYLAKIWGTIEGSPIAGATFIINAASTSGTTATLNIRRGSACTLEAIK